MTRKDYELIADVLSGHWSIQAADEDVRQSIITSFTEKFKKDNPRFDAGKFRDRCNGWNNYKINIKKIYVWNCTREEKRRKASK